MFRAGVCENVVQPGDYGGHFVKPFHHRHLPAMNTQTIYAPVPAYLPVPDNYILPGHDTAVAPARSNSPDEWGKGYVSWGDDDEDPLRPHDDDRPGVTVTWPSARVTEHYPEVDEAEQA